MTAAPALRIAVVSSGEPSGLAASLVRGFKQAGHHAEICEEPWPRRAALVAPGLLLRGRLPPGAIRGRKLLAKVSQVSPSLIVVVKGCFVGPSLVQGLRRVAPTICWNPDSPFDSALSNSGGFIQTALREYDAYVTWSESVQRCVADLRDRVYRIPFGLDLTLHAPVRGRGEAAGRVVFIGTASPERIVMVERLRHVSPIVYGNGWPADIADVRGPLAAEQLAAVAGEASWCLNPLRPQNRDSHNMRTFELMACGAAQLTFDTEDHRRFLPGSSAVLVSSMGEMIQRAGTPGPPLVDARDLGRHTYRVRCSSLLAQLADDGVIDLT